MIDKEAMKKEYDDLLQQLSDPELISDWGRFKELKNKKEIFKEILTKENETKEIKEKMEENREILKSQEDRELISLAEEEIIQLSQREKTLEKEIQNLIASLRSFSNSSKTKKGAVIIEIRAGAGGKEAALFAGDLFGMYSKYGQSQDWQQRILESNPTELGGFKEIIFEINGSDVFSKLKYEAGVHRVQRIPETEKSGRIHTSTASVAVLPKPKKEEIEIKPDDIKISFHKSSGPGGQYVNKRETAVRILHLPSGLVVTSQTERNQLQNKENALAILSARLLEKKERESAESISGKRRSQIGKAQRAEKIRTYNFPQNRVTDHRIKKSWHNLEQIMEGKLEKIIKVLQKSA